MDPAPTTWGVANSWWRVDLLQV
uniref:Uncharacterized protein n=1 Tax=Anguilla anguilla TaxID=7936 RepID=A0A0E9TDK0_ANGAN